MCGIAGIVFKEQKKTQFPVIASKMLEHRGPDDEGFLAFDGKCAEKIKGWNIDKPAKMALIHRRLSVIDISDNGRQPMSSEDARFHIVFNGEIYNYIELRNELKVKGYNFFSNSDTEVLLKSWMEWGAESINKFVGMFAFAIFDKIKNELCLVRDFFGIKPLYYAFDDSFFAFSSEIQPLLKLNKARGKVNPQRLYEYLRTGMTDYGGDTMFLNINQLAPSHYLKIKLNNHKELEIKRYYELKTGKILDISFEEAKKTVRELFLESVSLHLRSDVPVGTALSGGVDSSSIVCGARYLDPLHEILAFSFIPDEPSISEEKYADIASAYANVKIHKVFIKPEDLISDLEDLIKVHGEPFGSTSIYAQYRVFKLARENNIKVMLDGQGADEILGGYAPYTAARIASLVRSGNYAEAFDLYRNAQKLPGRNGLFKNTAKYFIPEFFKPLAYKAVGNDLIPKWINKGWFVKNNLVCKINEESYNFNIFKNELLKGLQKTYIPALLRYEDRDSMAHSVESRVPFLTVKLVEFMLSLPEKYIINKNGETKYIFKEAMRGIVPDKILDRKDKIGFATPEKKWLQAVSLRVEGMLKEESPFLNMKELKNEWRDIANGKKHFNFRVWRWLNLISWSKIYEIEA